MWGADSIRWLSGGGLAGEGEEGAGEGQMNNVVSLGVASQEDVERRLAAAFGGEPQGSRISFATPELLWKFLTQKRWELLRAMTGQGVMPIREAARRVGRDVKAVHGDVTALIEAGVIQPRERGVVLPCDAVHVDFMLGKAACGDWSCDG